MKKRGQSLSMNTIIITILGVLVLVVVAVFFTGGMASLITKIKGIVGTSAMDVSEARLKCTSWCNQLETTNIESYKEKYCTAFKVDMDGNGKLDTGETEIHCRNDLNVDCMVIDSTDCEQY